MVSIPKLKIQMCHGQKSLYWGIGDGHPTFNRNPYNGYINPYYWVDDHPLLYGNIGSLDPGTYLSLFVTKKNTSLTRLDFCEGHHVALKKGVGRRICIFYVVVVKEFNKRNHKKR